MARRAATCWITLACAVSLQVLLTPGMETARIVNCLCIAAVGLFGGFLAFVCRIKWFSCIELLIWGILCLLATASTCTSSDIIVRHRGNMLCLCMSLGLPQYFGMPWRSYIPYALWVVGLNIGALYLLSCTYDEVIPLRIYRTVVMYAVFYIGLGRQQQRFFSMLYDAEQAVAFDRDAAESLVSMFCDAHLWLASDEETVISSDHRFNNLIGRDMIGEAISCCFCTAGEDLSRFQKVLSEAPLGSKPAPVTVLSVALNASGRDVAVDMFIVGCRSSRGGLKKRGDRQYLIGICAKGEEEYIPAQRRLSLDATSELARVRAFESVSTPRNSGASGETTSALTGALFHDREGDSDVINSLGDVERLGKKEHWLVDKAELRIVPSRVLGEGGFGIVVQAIFYGLAVALKISKCTINPGAQQQDLSHLCTELRVLRRLRHPNLVQLLGAIVDVKGRRVALILDFVRGSNLTKFMELDCGPSFPARYQVLEGVCSALWYIHSRSPTVVHGDLKSDNILLERDGPFVRPKLLDFGLSRVIQHNARPVGGTLRYMAPEVFLKADRHPRPSVDVFSFGRLAFYLLTKQRPLSNMTDNGIYACFERKFFPATEWPQSSLSEESSWHNGRSFVNACLSPSPNRRPGMQEVHGMLAAAFPGLSGLGSRIASLGQTSEEEFDWNDGLQLLQASRGGAQGSARSSAQSSRTALSAPTCCNSTCVLPNLASTSSKARRRMLLEVLMQWNYDLPESMCCSFHAGALALQLSASGLHALPCRSVPHMYDRQCEECGALCLGICDLCAMSQEEALEGRQVGASIEEATQAEKHAAVVEEVLEARRVRASMEEAPCRDVALAASSPMRQSL